jgi:hypothetical protein
MIGTQDAAGEKSFVKLSLETSEQYLTLLLDPQAIVHAYSGILPVKELEIPEQFRRDALRRMEVFFRAGPVLTSVLERSDGHCEIVLPQPSEKQGTWEWMERTNDCEANKWKTYSITSSDEKDMPTRVPPTIREGVVKLKILE